MTVGPMVHLTTVSGAFHARVLVARLGAEGILSQPGVPVDGPYPVVGAVEVYVSADQLDAARQLLLADAVEAALDDEGAPLGGPSSSAEAEAARAIWGKPWRERARPALAVMALLVIVAFLAYGRAF